MLSAPHDKLHSKDGIGANSRLLPAQSLAARQAASSAEAAYRYRVEQVREEYLSTNGVVQAVRDALKGLFTEPRLPDNPYYYLANQLGAFVDQSPLWKLSDQNVVEVHDLEGGIEVTAPELRLCKHAATSYCHGLPHVVRLVSKDGANVLNTILVEGLPDAFFPSSTPFSTKDGYTVRVLCSVQGMSTVWRPQDMDFPGLAIRADVVVKGPRMEEAVKIFIDLVLTDMEEVHAVPVYFVDGLALMDAPSQQGAKEPFYQFFPFDDIQAKPAEFEKTAVRLILGNKCVKMTSVVLLDAPDKARAEDTRLRYEMVTKTYYFHYSSLEESKVGYDQLAHYGSLPFEALYEGYFISSATARQYLMLYTASDKEPYAEAVLRENTESLKRQVQRGLYHGNSLEAFRQLLLLVMLQDSRVTRAPQLRQQLVRPLEELISQRRSEDGMLFASLPNLMRILNSGAAIMQEITRELEAIGTAAQKWPTKLKDIQTSAGKLGPGLEFHKRDDGIYSAIGTGNSRRELRTAEVSSAMLAWLQTFDMELRLLTQLSDLKQRVAVSTGKGLFSGISIMVEILLRDIPDEPPTLGTARVMAEVQHAVLHVVHLLKVAALTVAHGFLGRCADVLWVLQRLGISVGSLVDAHSVALTGSYEDEMYVPDWVLDVKAVVGSQVRSGGVAERVGVEGVMLQYAVDTKLDELLTSLWLQVSQPPMPLNPYPKLMHIIRSRAAKMELWVDDQDSALAVLMNDLTLLRSPMFIYGATPSEEQAERTRKRGGAGRRAGASGGGDGEEDEDTWQVFGCYSAVALADARSLQALRASLSQVVADRHWQKGAYQGEVVPALVGEACLTNAMALDDDLSQSAAFGPGGGARRRGAGAAAQGPVPFEHPRFYTVRCEEHHLVEGPKKGEAAKVFGEEVVESLDHLHKNTSHVVHQIEVAGRTFTVRDVVEADRRADLVKALAAAAKSMHQGQRLACVHLYVAAQENVYVGMQKWLVFQHMKVAPALMPHQALTHALLRPVSAVRPSTADREKQYWDRSVYERVFLSDFNASTWYAWNRGRGDPAQPFHHTHMLMTAEADMRRLQAQGKLLELQKLMLLCAVVVQDDRGIYQLSRGCMSTAQELRVLIEMGHALVHLMGPNTDPLITAKLDNERLRKLFLMYCSRMRRAMGSPKSNYFTGLATLAPQHVNELKEHVLSTFKLGPRQLELLDQLQVWTTACEISVAAALHDCYDEDIKRRWLSSTEQRLASRSGVGVMRPMTANGGSRPGTAQLQDRGASSGGGAAASTAPPQPLHNVGGPPFSPTKMPVADYEFKLVDDEW